MWRLFDNQLVKGRHHGHINYLCPVGLLGICMVQVGSHDAHHYLTCLCMLLCSRNLYWLFDFWLLEMKWHLRIKKKYNSQLYVELFAVEVEEMCILLEAIIRWDTCRILLFWWKKQVHVKQKSTLHKWHILLLTNFWPNSRKVVIIMTPWPLVCHLCVYL